MNKKELKTKTREFIKTPIGKCFWYYANVPAVVLILLGVFSIILLCTEEEVNLKITICVLSFVIIFCTYCLAQLYYHKMLLDYLKEQKKKD